MYKVRIKQFIAAITAEILPADQKFIDKWLSGPEQKLFWAMSLPDQYHSLQVAYTAVKLSQQAAAAFAVSQDRLIRCALLHDVGKTAGDMSIMDKIVAVLAYNMFPDLAKKWGRYGKGSSLDNLRHAFYIYLYHAERSRDQLLSLGLIELAEIVAEHHKAPTENDPPELLLLRKADDLN
jgi:hypothetical protein